MSEALSQFSEDQIRFLSTLALFDTSISIDLLGQVSPLLPGPFLQLMGRCETLGWIERDTQDRMVLTANCPDVVRNRLDQLNTEERADEVVRMITDLDGLEEIGPATLSKLYAKAGRLSIAVKEELALVGQAFWTGNQAECIRHLEGMLHNISLLQQDPRGTPLDASIILALSDFCFATGAFLRQMAPVLIRTIEDTSKTGDKRAWALGQLHLGRLLYVGDQRRQAFDLLAIGKRKVEELGDEDILAQAFEFFGLYYYMQGLFIKAIEYFERSVQEAEAENRVPFNTAAVFLGYSAAYTGQFHRAIGSFDSHWHLARNQNNHSLAMILQASLGIVLFSIGKRSEAMLHLKNAWKEALDSSNWWAVYIAGGGLAYNYILNDELDKAVSQMDQYRAQIQEQGIVRQFSSPYIVEMLFRLEQAGYDLGEDWRFETLFERTMSEPNIHLRGVMLRLRAAAAIDNQAEQKTIVFDLEKSEQYLVESGDPVQLAKTHIEMARLKLQMSDVEGARILARKARRGLTVTAEDQFPAGLRFLLEEHEVSIYQGGVSPQTLEHAFQIIEELIPRPNFDEFLTLMVSAMARLFKAERSGVFWTDGVGKKAPRLRAACNLFRSDVASENFLPNLKFILQSFRERKPLVQNVEKGNRKNAVLCLPFAIRKRTRGVLYLDNSFLSNCFDTADPAFLMHLSEQLGAYFERIEEYSRFMSQAKSMARDRTIKSPHVGSEDIYTQNASMRKLLSQASRIAKSGATVLILGETGVGKEVLARWLHQNSHRSDRALVVIDATTIPENLVESELFGHEKGAFTGADARKIGRLELAHEGTLFIDEIGEISEPIQVKLLRVLQDKTFMRVGGTKNIASDFRLLAATNRDLAQEVEAGRFRRDLFYRLNVMELRIPSLRERKEDIVYLARHFLARYARRYNRLNLKLLPEHESSLVKYAWPGNIREMKNVMERAVLMSEKGHLEFQFSDRVVNPAPDPFGDYPSLDEMQRRYIKRVLEKTEYSVGDAANILKMNRTTLYSRIKKLGIGLP